MGSQPHRKDWTEEGGKEEKVKGVGEGGAITFLCTAQRRKAVEASTQCRGQRVVKSISVHDIRRKYGSELG